MLTIPQTSVFALGAIKFISVSSLKILYPSPISKHVRYVFIPTLYKTPLQSAKRKCRRRFHFFPLKLTEFGHPRHGGVFSSCTNAAEVLKAHVEKLPLVDENQIVVEDRSVGTVDAIHDTLGRRSMRVTQTVLRWATEWRKENLVEVRTQDEVTKHKILITKCLGADQEFRDFYEVR
jgi:hypothetical protein